MENKLSQSSLLIGIVIALLVAAVAGDMIYRSVFRGGESTPSTPEVSADAETVTEPASQSAAEPDAEEPASAVQESAESSPEPASELVTSDEENDEKEESADPADQPEEDITPEISIELQTVRVDSDGAVVIAGLGLPGQVVEILINGEVFETAIADGQGNFVSLFDLPYSDAVRILSLRSIVDGKEVLSNQDAIIAPAQIAAATPSASETEPEAAAEPTAVDTEIAQADAVVETESQPEGGGIAQSAETDAAESDQPVVDTEAENATTVVQNDAEPVEDSVGSQNAEPAKPAEPAQAEQDTADAPVVAAADEPETPAPAVNAADSVVAATDTDADVDVSVSEQAATPEEQSETDSAEAADTSVQQPQITQDALSTTELAAVSTKDSAQEPNAQQSDTQGSDSDSPAVAEAGDSKTDGATETASGTVDAEQSTDSGASLSASANEDTGEQLSTDSAGTTQVAAVEIPSDDTAEAAPEVQTDQTPTVMIADQDGVRVVQGGEGQSSSDVALDAISYDEEGEVALSGRGTPAAQVLVYLDNAPISSTVLDSAGQWKTDLTDVDPGVYTLRIDQLDTSGKVVSRLETPFQRENRERLIKQVAASAEPARVNVITVQPGYTLWAIARNRYGRGMLYVQVFEANRDKIRDPDLIYPGQVFQLPD